MSNDGGIFQTAQGMNMLFAVDIDGTIAKYELGEKSLIRYLNRELGQG
jgi:hypothetical protein